MFTKKGECHLCEKQKEECTTVQVGTVSGLRPILMCKECWDNCINSIAKGPKEE